MFNGTDVFWISRPEGIRHNYMKCQIDSLLPNAVHILAEDGPVRIRGKEIESSKKGCLRSHVLALREAKRRMRKTGHNMSLIFEDDVSIESGASLDRPSLLSLVSSLPSDWEIVQLGYHTHTNYYEDRHRYKTKGGEMPPLTWKGRRQVWALLAYLVSRRAVDAVWANTRVDADGTVTIKRGCGVSADDCVMNGRLIGRPWKGWFATPPLFWEPISYNREGVPVPLLRTTVGSNSNLHGRSSHVGSRWAREVFGRGERDKERETCERRILSK